MKSVYIVLALLHRVSAFVVETRIFQNRYRENLLTKPSAALPFIAIYTSKADGPARIGGSCTSLYSKPEEYDDGIGDINNNRNTNSGDNGTSSNSDGEALAADFFKNIQKRQQDAADANGNAAISTSSPSGQSRRNEATSSLFESNDYYNEKENQSPAPLPSKPKIKYTGRPTDGNGNNYFGASNTGTPNNNANGNNNVVRQQMMRREYDLVSGTTGRTALGLQAGLALSMLLFFAYVWFSGGIVSGEEAINADFGGGDDVIQFEQIIPVPRDTDNSVWL